VRLTGARAVTAVGCCTCLTAARDCLHATAAGRWADLPTVDQDVAALAAQLRTQLSGDPACQYATDEPGGSHTDAAADDSSSSGSSSGKLVTEVQRLRCIIDSINAATAVQPKVREGCWQGGCTACGAA
jgi:hypothetical protein